ncbi:MAG: hypothetical protein ACRD1H_11105 [Vicinamibacterales bacterium]
MEPDPGGMNPRDQRTLLVTLVGIAALCGAIGGFVLGGVTGTAQAPQLGDMSGAAIVEIRDASGRTVLSGEFRSRTGPLGKVEKDAALTDSRGSQVIGEVEIEIPTPNASDRGQELEVDIIKLTPRATFTVVIDDRPVTTFNTDDRGSIDVEIESSPSGQSS